MSLKDETPVWLSKFRPCTLMTFAFTPYYDGVVLKNAYSIVRSGLKYTHPIHRSHSGLQQMTQICNSNYSSLKILFF